MQIISGRTQFMLERHSALTIGKFDGIHRGHKYLLQEILEKKEEGLLAAVFTFDPPAAAFFSGSDIKELTTREEKRRRFAQMGVDVLVEYPLNKQTAAISPEDFIGNILVGQMKAGFIAAGEDLSFGYNGQGNSMLLEQMAEVYHYRTRIIDKICEEGREISSSYIREQIEGGNMKKAAALLGEPYMVTGEVVHGKQLGRTIGMPTVNLLPPAQKLLPPNGVYYSRVEWKTKKLNGITNIGCKPTVSSRNEIGVETYLYDFEEEIYGQELTVRLLEFKRPEQRFSGVEELRERTGADILEGIKYFEAEKN